ncbi:unnamed protein product [Gadus morhua 'NCC']
MNDNEILEMDETLDFLEEEAELGMIDEDMVYPQEFLPTYETIQEGAPVKKAEQADFNGKHDSLFFNDGVRRIDFVLVYEDEDKKDFDKRHTFQRKKRRREYLEASLMKMGRSVLLEQPRKSGSKVISHMLSSHGGEIFLHVLNSTRSTLEDPPSISEGCGGRVTYYRITVGLLHCGRNHNHH